MPDPVKTLTSILEGADLDSVAGEAVSGGESTGQGTDGATPHRQRKRTTSATSPPLPPPPAPDDPLATGMEDDGTEPFSVDADDAQSKKTEEKPAAKPKHSPRALELADLYGIDPEWASEAAPEELVAEINLAKAHADAAERFERQQEAKRKAEQEAREKAESDEAAELDLGEIEEEDDYGKKTKRKATLKDISPVVAKALLAQHKELKELKKFREEQSRREQAREAEQLDRAIDEGFSKLGKSYQTIFGDGDSRTLDRASQEFADRVTILRAANISPTDSPAQITKKVLETAKKVYGRFVESEEDTVVEPQPKKAAAKKDPLAERREQYANGAVARPTATRKQKPSALRSLLEDMDAAVTEEEDLDDFFGDGGKKK